MPVIDGYSEPGVLLVLFVLSDAWLGEWSYFMGVVDGQSQACIGSERHT
jgi:hypothetical protein